MLGIGFLAGLGREEKAGIERSLIKRAVLEPSSGSLGKVLEVLTSGFWKREEVDIRQQPRFRKACIHGTWQVPFPSLPTPKPSSKCR